MATLPETATWVNPVTGIDNGDPLDSTELTTPETQLAKRDNYLRTHTPSARDVTRKALPLMLARDAMDGAGAWAPVVATIPYWLQSDTSGHNTLELEIDGHHGVTVTEVRAHIRNASAHAALPAGKPVLVFWELDPIANTFTLVGAQTDTSASQAAYDAAHTITLVVSKTLDETKRYIVGLQGEYDTNAQNNKLGVRGLDISWTAPASV